jgi:hypothetical protein
MLIWITILVFAVAAVVGLTMAIAAFQGKLPPVAGAVLHGILAASGLVLLLVAVFGQGASGPAAWALGLLVVAALGGFTIAFGFHARSRDLPKGFVAVHAIVAVIGFLLLLSFALHLL